MPKLKSPLRKFVVKEGFHLDENNKRYETGDTVLSRADLIAIFPQKFREDKHGPVVEEEADTETEVSVPTKASKFGKDRTENFDSAEESGLKVYRNDDKEYCVVDPDEPDVALNKKPLKNSEVDSFIAKHLKKQE